MLGPIGAKPVRRSVGKQTQRRHAGEVASIHRCVSSVSINRRTRPPEVPLTNPPDVMNDVMAEIATKVAQARRSFDPTTGGKSTVPFWRIGQVDGVERIGPDRSFISFEDNGVVRKRLR